jgi:hypothetical protein
VRAWLTRNDLWKDGRKYGRKRLNLGSWVVGIMFLIPCRRIFPQSISFPFPSSLCSLQAYWGFSLSILCHVYILHSAFLRSFQHSLFFIFGFDYGAAHLLHLYWIITTTTLTTLTSYHLFTTLHIIGDGGWA